MGPVVIITDHNFSDLDIERSILDEVDAEVIHADVSTEDALLEGHTDADVIMSQFVPITTDTISTFPSLQAIGRYGIGVDTVDVEAAAGHGIQVINVPDYCISEVSTHAVGLILAMTRNIPQYSDQVKAGKWDWKTGQPIHSLENQVLGLVGFGKIPRRVREKIRGFDMDVVTYDPFVSAEECEQRGVDKVGFGRLLDISDVVSVHAPLTDDTRQMFDVQAFETMKPSAYLVNTARGGIIDTDALHTALSTGEIAGAGLDVLPNEPPGDEEKDLIGLDSVITTPHVSWYSEESIIRLRRTLAEDVVQILRGQEPQNQVTG